MKNKNGGRTMSIEKFKQTLAILGLSSARQVYNPPSEIFADHESKLLELFKDEKIVDEIIAMALAGEINTIKEKDFFQ
jgi:hypothetical protein